MLKKVILFFIVSFVFLFPFALNPRAQNEFAIDSEVVYTFNKNGTSRVTHKVLLENLLPTIYAKSYTLTLENIAPQDIKAKDGEKDLIFSENKKDSHTAIKVEFPDAITGRAAKRNFEISFEVNDFAVKTGEVWEISIPRLSQENSFRNYQVKLFIPNSFGKKAYISPEKYTLNNQGKFDVYTFSKETVEKTGVTAGFGEFQVFSFNLKYHLENPLNYRSETEIPLPPDSAFQKVYYDKISPPPKNITLDEDGNWLAKYYLSPRERIDIEVFGSVQIYAKERQWLKPSLEVLSANLKGTEFWQTDDPEIVRLANKLKSPKEIYDFVVRTLKYDYERVKPNVQRKGAKEALREPNSAICTEFTDLFIALARAAGIPAREVNGYAYTENPEIQPLSLVADVLHAWPEYWDEKRGVWIAIDPTWGKTTGGLDFFNKLDLRHFTFVIHGQDSLKPYPPGSYKLGSNPQKDVFVNFGKMLEIKTSKLNLSYHKIKTPFFLGAKFKVKVENPGPAAFYDLKPAIYLDNQKLDFEEIKFLLPYSSTEFEFSQPFNFLGRKTSNSIIIEVANEKLQIASLKSSFIIISLIYFFVLVIIIFTFVFLKIKRLKLMIIFQKLIKRKKENGNDSKTSIG